MLSQVNIWQLKELTRKIKMELTKEQNDVMVDVIKLSKDIQSISGYAGTGKSTLIAELIKKLPTFSVCAFTGKAASVLRRKGIPASTIHGLIYKPELDNSGKIIIRNGSPSFVLNPSLECEGIIVDEASMVGKDIYRDLCSFNVPLIFCGDEGQLEPIGEGINLMANPDHTLKTIHRNAGEIAFFAEFIRKGNEASDWKSTEGKVEFIDKMNAWDNFDQVDQIICAYNKTRVGVNKAVRKKIGRQDHWPVAGDRVMCLRNNKQRLLFNGMQGVVKQISPNKKNQMVFTSNEEDFSVYFNPQFLYCEKYDFSGMHKDDPDPFDYAYCITAHKSQGDQFNKVMVLEQKCKLWSHTRWAYTVASRAIEKILWVPGY